MIVCASTDAFEGQEEHWLAARKGPLVWPLAACPDGKRSARAAGCYSAWAAIPRTVHRPPRCPAQALPRLLCSPALLARPTAGAHRAALPLQPAVQSRRPAGRAGRPARSLPLRLAGPGAGRAAQAQQGAGGDERRLEQRQLPGVGAGAGRGRAQAGAALPGDSWMLVQGQDQAPTAVWPPSLPGPQSNVNPTPTPASPQPPARHAAMPTTCSRQSSGRGWTSCCRWHATKGPPASCERRRWWGMPHPAGQQCRCCMLLPMLQRPGPASPTPGAQRSAWRLAAPPNAAAACAGGAMPPPRACYPA